MKKHTGLMVQVSLMVAMLLFYTWLFLERMNGTKVLPWW
jgi:hypothetical protein